MGMAATESQFHVLAVDDNLIDRKLIERLLKTSSYQVTTVDSGSKALEFLGFHEEGDEHQTLPDSQTYQEVEVNLIITDYCMPGMTGYDLLRKIKESSSLRNIPVVIMSSENVPSRINRCLEEGAEEFFLKPVQLSDLKKLRPYLMKTKLKEQNLEEAKEQEIKVEEIKEEEEQEQEQEQGFLEPEILLQDHQQIPNNNKRKGIEVETLSSPDSRTRPRYTELASVV